MTEAIFSSLPEALQLETLCSADELAKVRRALESRPGEWQTMEEISNSLGWPAGRTGEKIRRAIKELQALRVPIVTGHAGAMIATRVEMVDACIKRESHRLQGLQREIKHLTEIREHMSHGQQPLEWWRRT